MMMEEEHIVTHCVTALLITFIKAITSRSCIPMCGKSATVCGKSILYRARPMYRASCAHFHTHPVPFSHRPCGVSMLFRVRVWLLLGIA
jgi:hypothetical protein